MGINNICCIGGDHLGGSLCAVMAFKCPEIRFTVLDNSSTAIAWNSDNLPFYEPDLDEIVKKCRNRNLFFSSDYAPAIKEADMIFISINDPTKSPGGENKQMDIKKLEDAARLITTNSISDKIIVEKSTFCTKATERLNMIINSLCVPGVNIEVISCPDILTERSAIHDLLNPDRILIGVKNNPKSRTAANALKEIYEHWVPSENIIIINMRSADIAKVAANVFLGQRISTINSFSQICEKGKGDISEISRILGKYPKIGPKCLQASLGFGGFNKEITGLVSVCESAKLIENARYWHSILDFNNYQKKRFMENVISILAPIEGKDIGIWGFTCKKNTSDTKFSPAIEVCCKLLAKGARIKIFDPKAQKQQILKDLEAEISDLSLKVGETESKRVLLCDDPYAACENSEAVILCTDWDEFQELQFTKVASLMKKPIVFDGKRILDPTTLRNSGIEYYSVGLGDCQ